MFQNVQLVFQKVLKHVSIKCEKKERNEEKRIYVVNKSVSWKKVLL